jgi:hypothetical protein
MTVAALYIDPRGPYPSLVGPELCWDEARDARTYAGPWPVVAHPPCGPWGRLSHFCTTQKPMMALGVCAVEQVRKWGGILEHPEGSRLFDAMKCRGDGIGKLWYVEQGAWGHIAQKRTILYSVGVSAASFWKDFARCRDTGRRVESLSKEQRRRTPIDFARWLISLAEQVQPRTALAECR